MTYHNTSDGQAIYGDTGISDGRARGSQTGREDSGIAVSLKD